MSFLDMVNLNTITVLNPETVIKLRWLTATMKTLTLKSLKRP